MHRPGKRMNTHDNTNSPDEEHKAGNRRSYALIGGLVGLIVIGIYIMTALFPSRLFSMPQDNVSLEQKPVLYNAHPDVPDGPLKRSSIALFASTDKVWTKLFRQMGKTYTRPALQLFEDTVTANGCGYGLPVTGPFYCEQDKVVYLDVAFFDTLKKNMPASADLAQAYLVAHQVGHHVQALLGTDEKLENARANMTDIEFEKLAEKKEFQADFYAGIWAHYAYKKTFYNTDLEIAISAATKTALDLEHLTDRTEPGYFNYANISERAKWFSQGYYSGSIKQADNVFDKGDLE